MTKKEQTKMQSVMVELELRTEALTKKDISTWRRAWQSALNIERPVRNTLYSIYLDALIDNHLSGCIEQRKDMVLQKAFRMMDDSGSENENATRMMEAIWFKQLLAYILDSRYWGHSLIELGSPVDMDGRMMYDHVSLVPRQHVIPEYGVIVKDQYDDIRRGYAYREGPLSEWVVEAGSPKDLGLLLKAAPQTISKRYALGFWDQFAEVFGIPVRIIRTNIRDVDERNKLTRSIAQMGACNYGIFPDGTDIDIKENSKNDSYNVFDKRIDRANSEMSKLILGQTMTTDNGSSKAQGEVHLDVLKNIVAQDADFVRDVINGQLLPRMVRHGFPVKGLTFDWNEQVDYTPEEQRQIEQMLLDNYEVDPKYFEEKYNIRITGKKQVQSPALSKGFFD